MNQHTPLIIGRREAWRDSEKVGQLIVLPAADRLKHLYVIGKTGVGKSTLLENFAKQDIEAGQGLAFFDPHGGSFNALLDYVPRRRVDDVVVFDPAGDREFPVAINLLGSGPKDGRYLRAAGIVAMLKHIWRTSWSDRMERLLLASLLALLDQQDSTFVSLLKLLTDDEYRAWVVSATHNKMARAFFADEVAEYGTNFFNEVTSPVLAKVERYLASPVILNILGQPRSTFDFRGVMDSRKIFLANLSKGGLGEDATNLLGSMLATGYQLRASFHNCCARRPATRKIQAA
jgi:Type IV secretion-system coupling protein DNA-binding domain